MYRDLNDYEILYMVCEDDSSDDFNVLYKKYQPLIYKISKEYQRKFKNFGYELDDLMQIGYITLYKCSYLYNEYNSAIFYSYLLKSIKNAINYEIRKNTSIKKQVLNESFSYDNLIPNTNNSYVDILPDKKINIDFEEEKKHFITFKNTLSFLSAGVFEMYYNGFNLKEICKLLDEDMKTINNCLCDIKEKAFTSNYLFFN